MDNLLNGLMIAPLRKVNVLFGFLISGLITRSYYIALWFTICYYLNPNSFTILYVKFY